MEKKKYVLFVLIALFTLQVSAQEYYEVVAKQLNVMNAPTLDGQVLGQLKEHALVKVLCNSKGWATIEYNEVQAFVVLAGLQAVGDEEEEPDANNTYVGGTPSATATVTQAAQQKGVPVDVIPTKLDVRRADRKSMHVCLSFIVCKDTRVDQRTYIHEGSTVDVEVLCDCDKQGFVIFGPKFPIHGYPKLANFIRSCNDSLGQLIFKPSHIVLANGRSIPIQCEEMMAADVVRIGKNFSKKNIEYKPFTVYVTPQGTN